MKTEYIRSQGLLKGFRVTMWEDREVKEMLSDPAKLTIVTDAMNKYYRQKDALVDGRFDLVSALQKATGVGFLMKTVKVDGKDTSVPDETEGEYLARLYKEATTDPESVFASKLKVTGQSVEQREASLDQILQRFADACGDTTSDGKPVARDAKTGELTGPGYSYKLDMTRPERKAGKPKTPPQYAIEGATNIINNHAEAKWIDRWTKGYKNSLGIVIDPIAFEPFNVQPPKNAKPEEVEAVRQQNITNLAWAIADDKGQVLAKTGKAEYA